LLAAAPAAAWTAGEVDVLAVLPDASPGQPSSVEGLTVGPDGNIYYDVRFNAKGALTGNAVLYVTGRTASCCARSLSPIQVPHAGIGFNPVTGSCWCRFGAQGSACRSDHRRLVGLHGPIAGSGLNALTFDRVGKSTSPILNGVIWKSVQRGSPTAWATIRCSARNWPDAAIGAERRRVQQRGHREYMCQHGFTSDHQDPGQPGWKRWNRVVFITGSMPRTALRRPARQLWICANRRRHHRVDDRKVIAKLGDFNGIDERASHAAFCFRRARLQPGRQNVYGVET